jgi:hypothetical protein
MENETQNSLANLEGELAAEADGRAVLGWREFNAAVARLMGWTPYGSDDLLFENGGTCYRFIVADCNLLCGTGS